MGQEDETATICWAAGKAGSSGQVSAGAGRRRMLLHSVLWQEVCWPTSLVSAPFHSLSPRRINNWLVWNEKQDRHSSPPATASCTGSYAPPKEKAWALLDGLELFGETVPFIKHLGGGGFIDKRLWFREASRKGWGWKRGNWVVQGQM